MLWRLCQIYWLVSVLDFRCTAFDETSTLKVKTKNNGKIDPFSFEVFSSSTNDDFGKFSQNEEDDPDMALFFKDMHFFDEDDDPFYRSSFGGDNTTIKDFFSESLEKSRNRYMEDVNNIDKMFRTPMKSNIDELLRGETTYDDASSTNLNTSERSSILNINTERNVYHTTKRSTDISPNSLNTQIPMTHLVNPENSPRANSFLFSDVPKAAGSSVVTKLTSMMEKEAKDVIDNRDGYRESRGANTHEELLDLEEMKLENAFLKSSNIVTEISVQETVNGKTVERKPSSEELRLIETKILGSPTANAKEQTVEKFSRQLKGDGELEQLNSDKETATQEEKLPNEVIDDLSSILKVDPSFVDDDADKMLIDDEEVHDMDSILSDDTDNESNNNSNQESATKIEEISKNILVNSKNEDKGQSNQENNNNGHGEDAKSTPLPTNREGEDPRDYRKIFHTEHKNSSNVSDVKITFSETEGDFLDDDDGDEYASNITQKPDVVNKEEISKGAKANVEELNAVDTPDYVDKESLLTEASNSQKNKDLSEIAKGQYYHNFKAYDETTPSNKIDVAVTEKVGVYDSTELSQQTIGNVYATETIPYFTTEELMEEHDSEEESTRFTKYGEQEPSDAPNSILDINSLMGKKTVVSSQNINDTMHSEHTTALYGEIEDSITFVPKISYTTTETHEELDDIDRTMALIKQILAENEDFQEKNVDETSQSHGIITKSPGVKDEDVKTSSDFPTTKETVTIPLDTSTIQIDPASDTEAFTETTTYFKEVNTRGELLKIDDSSVGYGSTQSSLDFISTIQTKLETEGSLSGYSVETTDNTTPILSGTEPSLLSTTIIADYARDTQSPGTEVVDTEAPNSFSVKETESESHEPSSSEVESIYNSKIEEYESLEDNGDISDEKEDTWTLFGTKDKEYGNTLNKDNDLIGADGKETFDPDKFGDVHQVVMPVLRGILLNKTVEFSLKISTKDETFFVPSSAQIQECAKVINITWRTNDYLNNSIALRIFETENYYMIKEIMINLLTGNAFVRQKKSVAIAPDPVVDNSISGPNRVVRMKDGTDISFSSVDFLRKNYEPLEYSEASMRQRRLWHIEIAFICLVVVAVIAAVFYGVAVKTKRKITLREKNELAQVTHC